MVQVTKALDPLRPGTHTTTAQLNTQNQKQMFQNQFDQVFKNYFPSCCYLTA